MNNKDSNIRDMSEYREAKGQKNPNGGDKNDGNGNLIRYRLDNLEKDVNEIKGGQKQIERTLFHINGGIENLNGQMKRVPGTLKLFLIVISPIIILIINEYIKAKWIID